MPIAVRDPLSGRWHIVHWIDSKASFGDDRLHAQALEGQYRTYLNRCGCSACIPSCSAACSWQSRALRLCWRCFLASPLATLAFGSHHSNPSNKPPPARYGSGAVIYWLGFVSDLGEPGAGGGGGPGGSGDEGGEVLLLERFPPPEDVRVLGAPVGGGSAGAAGGSGALAAAGGGGSGGPAAAGGAAAAAGSGGSRAHAEPLSNPS